jgi:hypothetical protein
MQTMMKAAGYKTGYKSSLKEKSMMTVEAFESFVAAATLNKPELEGELSDWNKGKVRSDAVMQWC